VTIALASVAAGDNNLLGSVPSSRRVLGVALASANDRVVTDAGSLNLDPATGPRRLNRDG
jgi:hypothetical protein